MNPLKFAANTAFLWPDIADPLARLREAAKEGFRRVERTFVHDLDLQELRRALDENQLQLTVFDAFPGDWEKGERGLLSIPNREVECRGSIEQAIEQAVFLGTHLINVLAGILPDNVSNEEALDVASENLLECAPRAEKAGVSLLVEAINTWDMPGYALPTVTSATQLVELVDHPAVGLQFDAYHVAAMGGDVVSLATSTLEQIRHVQIADVPGRHEPGTGDLPWDEFFAVLKRSYGGVVGLEYHPERSTKDSFSWLPRALRG